MTRAMADGDCAVALTRLALNLAAALKEARLRMMMARVAEPTLKRLALSSAKRLALSSA